MGDVEVSVRDEAKPLDVQVFVGLLYGVAGFVFSVVVDARVSRR